MGGLRGSAAQSGATPIRLFSVIESASSRGYDIYWARVGNWVVFPAEEKEESCIFIILYMTWDEEFKCC